MGENGGQPPTAYCLPCAGTTSDVNRLHGCFTPLAWKIQPFIGVATRLWPPARLFHQGYHKTAQGQSFSADSMSPPFRNRRQLSLSNQATGRLSDLPA
jgi:hypothetical protein